jgi:hypothetical protein
VNIEKKKRELRQALTVGIGSQIVTVIVSLILFWPWGIYMLHGYLSVFKIAAVGGSKALRGTGIALLVLGAICLIMGISPMEFDDGEKAPLFYHLIMFCAGGGIAYGGFSVFKTAKKFEALSPTYKQYLMAIVTKDCYNVEELAVALGIDYNTALLKVEEMVDCEIFQGAYVDYQTKELVWGERPVSQNVTVSCPSCGGSSEAIVGKNNRCQYCGSGLAI